MLRVISEVRGFIVGGIIKPEKVDAELSIPDGIEEKLNQLSLQAALNEVTTPVVPVDPGGSCVVSDGK
ncbi:MAG: hypothetical protein N2578_08105, partial [Bdellovibrionaceae bacterium]|nr:hypothetical protein [Pseudobdellovibrionaceae bacterium]